jgi:hypothetical protein
MGEHIEKLVELTATQKVRSYTRNGKEVRAHVRKGDGPDHRAYVRSEGERLAKLLKDHFPQLTDDDLADIAASVGNSEV